MSRWREVGLFLLCSILICLAVFRGAFWGSRILAPVDIAPAIFSKYHYVDPAAGNVPANHYIIDQLTFDLPLQYTIYGAYRHGEIPWWDPYTFAGRPFLADAHVNGTDPIRILCYLTLPFVPAYNWNLILKSILTGLGMFLLLRHLSFARSISLPLALTFQFAGCFALFFSHPWIQASFAYYPFLWMGWSRLSQQRSLSYVGWSAALCGLIFYSGNLQSHAYLPLFALCFLFGNALVGRKLPLGICFLVSLSIAAGAAMAAPVLWPEVEFYLNSLRPVSLIPSSELSYLSGIASFATIFPWSLGTFRTLDLGKFAGNDALGFVIYIGSAAFVLALIGAWKGADILPQQNGARRTAIGLLLLYFLVCSTPLLQILYTRMAPIAAIGLTVLSAFGLSVIRGKCFPKVGSAVAGTALAIFVGLNAVAFIIYPRWISYVHSFVVERDKTNTSFAATPALRSFQVENLPHEISWQNPETVLAFVSLVALAIYLRQPRSRAFGRVALLAVNFLPPIFFFCRYVPDDPTANWERLLAGGPEQLRVAHAVNPNHLRLLETSPVLTDMLFPNNMGHLQQVHTVHGYSALHPPSLFHWPSDERPRAELVSDFVYRTDRRGEEAGELTRVTNEGTSRLSCSHRKVAVVAETMNTLTVMIEPGSADTLVRTDTFYPGWRAQLDGEPIPLEHSTVPFSTVKLPASKTGFTITYAYRPSFAVVTTWLSAIAVLIVVGMISGQLFKRSEAN